MVFTVVQGLNEGGRRFSAPLWIEVCSKLRFKHKMKGSSIIVVSNTSFIKSPFAQCFYSSKKTFRTWLNLPPVYISNEKKVHFFFFFFKLTFNLGLVILLIYLYSIHRVICRPLDHSVERPREIRTRDRQIQWQGL